MTPTGLETFGFDPHVSGLLVSKKIQSEVTKDRQIVVSMTDTNS